MLKKKKYSEDWCDFLQYSDISQLLDVDYKVVFFNWSPPNFLSTRSHVNPFVISRECQKLLRKLDLDKLGGLQLKKKHPRVVS